MYIVYVVCIVYVAQNLRTIGGNVDMCRQIYLKNNNKKFFFKN